MNRRILSGSYRSALKMARTQRLLRGDFGGQRRGEIPQLRRLMKRVELIGSREHRRD